MTPSPAESLPPAQTESGLEQYVSVDDVASALRVSHSCVRNWERKKILQGHRLYGALRFRVADVKAMAAFAVSAPRRLAPAGLLAAGGRPPKRRGRR